MKPQDALREAAELIDTRGKERDNEGERSMARTVKAFNAMFDKDLTETEGWQFMALLKMSRAIGGNFREDDYVDGAAYTALAGESASNKKEQNLFFDGGHFYTVEESDND